MINNSELTCHQTCHLDDKISDLESWALLLILLDFLLILKTSNQAISVYGQLLRTEAVCRMTQSLSITTLRVITKSSYPSRMLWRRAPSCVFSRSGSWRLFKIPKTCLRLWLRQVLCFHVLIYCRSRWRHVIKCKICCLVCLNLELQQNFNLSGLLVMPSSILVKSTSLSDVNMC